MHKTAFTLTALATLACFGCNKREDQDTAKAGNVATLTASNTNNAADNVNALANSVGRDLNNAANKTADAVRDTADALATKARDWKLTPDDLRADLEKSGRIVRSKSAEATDTARAAADTTAISSAIRTKYAADPDLSATDIRLNISDGVVSLDGEVANLAQLSRAITLALDTTGVHEVVSNLKVKNKD